MHPIHLLLAIAALAVGADAADAAGSDKSVVQIGESRELFVDRHLIDKLDGLSLQLHPPRSAGAALRFDKPWEGLYAGYVTVLRSPEGQYQLYYRGKPDETEDGVDEYTCYAQSSDGITWERPDLGLHIARGSSRNNIILAEQPLTHNFAPFLDTRPGVPPEQRYKALAGTSRTGLVAFVSADGKTWRKLRESAVFNDEGWVFDSQNVAFWSESEQCYVLFYRKSPNGIRAVARATSKDFINWSTPAMMEFSSGAPTLEEQLYTNQTAAYFRAPQFYIATAARFLPGRQSIVHGAAEPANWHVQDCSDTVLMSSRGGNVYDRTFMEALVRPGVGAANWTSRSNYAACGIVQTGETEMSMYIQRHYGFPTHELERLVFRLDGFASVHAPHGGGEMITRPLRFDGAELELNYSTSAAGVVRVELQDETGKPIPGHALEDCLPLVGDEVARIVQWKQGPDVSRVAGHGVRLRFVIKDADLYSMRFAPQRP